MAGRIDIAGMSKQAAAPKASAKAEAAGSSMGGMFADLDKKKLGIVSGLLLLVIGFVVYQIRGMMGPPKVSQEAIQAEAVQAAAVQDFQQKNPEQNTPVESNTVSEPAPHRGARTTPR